MTDMAFLGNGGDLTKKIRLYRNGDDNFFGKDFVLNPRQCRNYDAFLQLVTNHLQFGQAVRSIHTPVGGTEITEITTFKDKADYVAVSSGRFKKIPYPQLYNRHVQKLSDCKKRKEKNLMSADRDDNRIYAEVTRGMVKSTTNDIVSIWVYCNGEEFEPARRVILKPRMLQNWGLIYTEINQHINPHFGAVRCLYTMDGSLVSDVDQLRTGGFYVASSRFSGFKNVGYGARRAAFNVSTKLQHPRITEEHEGVTDEYPDGSGRGGGGGEGGAGGAGGRDNSVQTEPIAPSKPKTRKKRFSDAQVIYSDGTRVFRRYKKRKKAKKNAKPQKEDDEEMSKKSSNFRARSPYDETFGAEEIHEINLSELDDHQSGKTMRNNGYKAGAEEPKDMKTWETEGTSHQKDGVKVIRSREYTQDDAASTIQKEYRSYRRRQIDRQMAASKLQAEQKQEKESDQTGGQIASSSAQTGPGHDAGANATRGDDSKSDSLPQTEGNASDAPKQEPDKSGLAKKENGKREDSATKDADQSAVPATKEKVNHSSKESPKQTKSNKKK